MTHKLKMTAAAAAIASLAAPAFAQSLAEEMPGNSPAITDDGAANDVASQSPNSPGNDTARYGLGIAAFDDNNMTLSQEAFLALSNTRGANLETESGEVLGQITAVDFNARGFPELVVDLEPKNPLDAETLRITVQPGNVDLRDGKIFLAVSVNELIAKAQADGVRDDANAEVTIF